MNPTKIKRKQLKMKKKGARKRNKKRIEKRNAAGEPKTHTNEEIRNEIRGLREEVRKLDDHDALVEIDYHGTFNVGTIGEDLRRFVIRHSGSQSRVKGMRLITGQGRRFRKGSKIRKIVKQELTEMKKDGLIESFSFENQSTNTINKGCIVVLFKEDHEKEEEEDDDDENTEKKLGKPPRNPKKEKEIIEREWREKLLEKRRIEELKLKKKRQNYLRRERKKKMKQKKKEELNNNNETSEKEKVVAGVKVNPLDDSFDTTEDIDTMIDFINNI